MELVSIVFGCLIGIALTVAAMRRAKKKPAGKTAKVISYVTSVFDGSNSSATS